MSGTHLGIRLRISVPGGPIVDADSDHLHWIAKFGGPSTCLPRCLPGCQDHGWFEMIPGHDMALIGNGGLTVEIKAADLPDYVPDDDD